MTATKNTASTATTTANQTLASARQAAEKMLDLTNKATAVNLKALKTVTGFGPEALRPKAPRGLPVTQTRQILETSFDLYQGLAVRQRRFVLDLLDTMAPTPRP